jgi:endoglucanase
MVLAPKRLVFAAALFASLALPLAASATEWPELSLIDGVANENSRDLVMRGRLSKAARWPVMASIRIAGGEARVGEDYLAPAPQLITMLGELEAKIILTLRDDRKVEGDETAILALGRVEGASTGRGRAIALIRDDEPAPRGFQQASLGNMPAEPLAPKSPLGAFSTWNGRIVDASGQPVRLHGVNWFGLETPNFAPHGIWKRDWRGMMRQMRELGFNLIRLPYSKELLRQTDTPNGIDF